MKTVKVRISKDGKTTILTEGFQGEGCLKVARAFAGGDKVTSEQPTAEFFQQVEQAEEQQQ